VNRSEIVDRRSDMSIYLVHWTTKDDFNAIVRSGLLMPGRAPRWYWEDIDGLEGDERSTIYGPRSAVCFTEMPIGNWVQSITACRRYSDLRWGIAIPKRILYAYGARPVLYVRRPEYDRKPKCPEEELWDSKCPNEEKFRLCNFRYTPKPDWTHEREWRVCANVEINEKIGLKNDTFFYRCNKGDRAIKKPVQGNSIVPIHLPGLTRGKLDEVLSDNPQFVIIVESESDKESVKEAPPQPVAKAITQEYSPIAEYREKYLSALQKAQVVSVEYARDARDRLDLWSLEELLSKGRLPRIATLWDKARTETHRQVLGLIGEEAACGYEYYPGRDLWSIPPQGIILRAPTIGERIEECEQAVEVLERDVRVWLYERFGISET